MTTFPGDGADLSDLLSHLQQQVAGAQEQLGAEEVEGTSGGGAVRIRVSGELSFNAVHIDEEVIAAGEARVVEDLVLAALRDAATKLSRAREAVLGNAMGDMLGSLFLPEDGEADEEDEDEPGRDASSAGAPGPLE